MKITDKNIESRIEEINKELEKIRKVEKKFPQGELQCFKNENRYKWKIKEENGLHYLPKTERNQAEMLAMKKYYECRKKQRKNVDYRAFRNVGYNKCRDAHRGRMFRLLWTFVDLKLPSAMSHAIHKIVSIKRCQSYFISRRSPHLGISKDSESCASAHRCLHYAYARLIARVTFYLVVQRHLFQFHKQISYRLSA